MEKNLQSSEAVTKLQDIIKTVRTCMLITSGKSGKNATRPMAVVDVDAHGNIWFFAGNQSNKIQDIEADQQVQLVFSHPGKEAYLDIHGRASVETDRKYIQDKWDPLVKAWFPEGADDPALCLIRVRPDDAYYWDIENTKVGAMVKIALSAVTGKKREEGVHGQMHF
ncbi:pyridoxamine 5'-phosphate oxidase family protein [Sediminibacterium soli]|uniref:pyridoxamine 5'-phosphate oxidase family protein n=1 Tax=Sediminibacterium soli TaxID=2698829 RepID=UPI00137B25B5|nr:pyridoxamine 5'-phosphate oxidase family protein [Sediminibacterium soli]NCI45877.1 pyridoxamine 5'-phosphate oxidase family protein [Sediminibacterium soli]